VVRYPTGDEDAGRLVADALGGLPIEEDGDLSPGTVRVYLGKNYAGPGKRRTGGALLHPRGTAPASEAARTAAPISEGIERASVPTLASPVPPPPAPPRPTMVGGDVPCVS
jgi:hypothetical protein